MDIIFGIIGVIAFGLVAFIFWDAHKLQTFQVNTFNLSSSVDGSSLFDDDDELLSPAYSFIPGNIHHSDD